MSLSPEYADVKTGQVGTSLTDIEFVKQSVNVLVINRHTANKLYVQLKKDASTWNSNLVEIPPATVNSYPSINFPVRQTSIRLKGEAANTDYTAVATLED